jgi:hypothetical protein
MSVRPKMHPAEKFAWVAILITLTVLEVIAIKKNDEENLANLINQNSQFKQSQDSLFWLYFLNQSGFQETVNGFSRTNDEENRRFNALVKQDQRLFDHEKQLADAQSGVLSPGNEPTPSNGCDRAPVPKDSILVIFAGGNAIVASTFPQSLFLHRNQNAVQSLELGEKPNRDLFLVGAVRSEDGKVMAELSENGWMINRNTTLGIVEDKHSLIVYDLYGKEALNIRYLNSRAISVTGTEIELINHGIMTNSCFASRYPFSGP